MNTALIKRQNISRKRYKDMAKTKIVVLDGYTENPGDLSWDGLSALGDVTVYDRTSYPRHPLSPSA